MLKRGASGLGRSLIVALAATSVAASAQISEADLLARCQNNQAGLDAIRAQLSQTGPAYWSEEQLALARTIRETLVQKSNQIALSNDRALAEIGNLPNDDSVEHHKRA